MEPALTFQHQHRVTYAECTVGNHIYYARYLNLLEEARGEFSRHLGESLLKWQEAGTIFPVIECRLRYKGAARYDDLLEIELWLTELARVRLEFQYRILIVPTRTEIVTGSTIHACTSTDDKLKRIPPELAEKLKPYVKLQQAPSA